MSKSEVRTMRGGKLKEALKSDVPTGSKFVRQQEDRKDPARRHTGALSHDGIANSRQSEHTISGLLGHRIDQHIRGCLELVR